MELRSGVSKTKKLAISGIVMALYVVIMIVTQGFAFGPIQVRIATTLYALAYIYPFLVLPLGLSNVLSNMLGGLGPFDIIGGGLVGIIASLLVYSIRRYRINTFAIILPIIFVPGLVVPIWLTGLTHVPYKALAISLCLGQVIPAVLGAALVKTLKGKIGE
ncbi:QueT transporter family protein [Clostridium cellulovorans]|uniref:QueT transporter n=1 Tax=Clostridium cellulovorans (strain ATCC 35296 / DSM 3052 / OCM 3 / 743B) TaxID=573061 RepID=D9SUQ6_CLOC7|nr:QueT transporter family protein [Clostridium cellulovorans]ADL50961.1 protein of unknown function DUF988 [Clostridium cellulovorans 743B]